MEKRANQVEEIHVCVCVKKLVKERRAQFTVAQQQSPFPAHNHVDCLKAQLHVLSAEV